MSSTEETTSKYVIFFVKHEDGECNKFVRVRKSKLPVEFREKTTEEIAILVDTYTNYGPTTLNNIYGRDDEREMTVEHWIHNTRRYSKEFVDPEVEENLHEWYDFWKKLCGVLHGNNETRGFKCLDFDMGGPSFLDFNGAPLILFNTSK